MPGKAEEAPHARVGREHAGVVEKGVLHASATQGQHTTRRAGKGVKQHGNYFAGS
jgi:hypothetical protein